MKKMTLLLIAALLALALSGCGGDGLEYAALDGYAQVTGRSGSQTELVIAAAYKGLPVTAIADAAFADTDITAVTIPDSVAMIGDSAFYNCRSLTALTLPEGTTRIGRYAF